MSIDAQHVVSHEEGPLTREDVERLLREAGSPEKLDLSERNLREINLTGFDLVGVNLSKAKLKHAILIDVDLSFANLIDADLSNADLSRAILYKANLSYADLNSANLSGADISGASLSGATLHNAHLIVADLIGTNLSNANLREAYITRSTLNHTNLSGADLSYAHISLTDFIHTNLKNADFFDTNAVLSTFKNTILSEKQKEQMRGGHLNRIDETKVKLAEEYSTLLIRIVEEPLTPYDLATIIMALTELITELWLISKGRFADLTQYTETRNVRFAQEAGIMITEISYNSPCLITISFSDTFKGIAEAVVILLDGIAQIKLRYREREIEINKKEVKYKLEHAQKAIELVNHSEVDDTTKTTFTRIVLTSVEPLLDSKATVLALPPPKTTEGEEGIKHPW